ncbi:protein shortage in chiasmata 1 ortholog-like [Ptychodera flava]|uniref:protein shortage in chiasmata 1 ortholog-like n=1 Tax=Ptychodera flava TaxID=63121 RepID=UPI00396A7831
MPRFLATDYLRDAVKIRQALMNRMLMVLPAHLECTETYPHRCVNDSLYRTPWKRAQNIDKVVQFNEADIAEDLNKLCCQDFTGVIQSCNSFTRDIQALEEEDILEIIPSSNPDSPRLSSHQLQEIQQQTQQLSTQELLPFKEVFDKRDVSVFMKTLEYGGMLFFEELIEDINMRQYLHNIPTLSQLCERLPAQTVCDPLVDKDGKPFKEKEVFRLNEELLKNDKPEEKEHCKESFVKADICPKQDGFLDESLIGDSAAVSLTMEQMPSTQKLQDILRLTQEDVDKDISHCSQDFSVLVQTCNSDSTMDQSTRLSAISPVEDGQIDDFVQLNSQGLNRSPGKTDKVKAAILESPMEDDNHIIHQTLSQMIKKLEPCEVSPCQTPTILSSNEKKEEENKLWQQEKYLSEITRLTLQEPSCTEDTTIEDSAISVIKELGLQGEDIECDLELQLPWDPLSASTKEITHHRKLLDTLSLGQQDMVEDREIYIKYESQLFLYGK